MSQWQADKCWADKCMPYVRSALGHCFFRAGTHVEDTREGTDMRFVEAIGSGRVAVRIRRAAYIDRYMGEVTLRACRDSGAQTELSKLIEGDVLANWFFYGFAGEEDQRGRVSLAAWIIIDMLQLGALLRTGAVPCSDLIPNGDGTHFVAIHTEPLARLRIVENQSNWEHRPARRTFSNTR